MKKLTDDYESAAIKLATAIKKLRTRMQEVAPSSSTGLPISQVSILNHLRVKGSQTAAALAAAEQVSQQAIAQNLASLKCAGLVQRTPDPTDGRKILIDITDTGNNLFESIFASRNFWLAQAIDSTITAKERPVLYKAIELLERLADVK